MLMTRAVPVLLALVVALLALPMFLRYARTLHADALLDAAVIWPADEPGGGLPTARDATALARARAALELLAAQTADPQVQRMLGYAAAAAGDWPAAAKAFDAALRAEPASLLIAWQAALAYEQMALTIDSTPTQPLLAAQCQPSECISGDLAIVDPRLSDAAPIMRSLLVLPAGGNASFRVDLPAESAGLRFLVGWEPDAPLASAELRIWVLGSRADGIVYSGALSAAEQGAAWTPAWADLSPWAGQTVELVLEVQGDLSARVAWVDLKLTSAQAAHYTALSSQAMLRERLLGAGNSIDAFIVRAYRATRAGQPALALRWLERGSLIGDTGDQFWLEVGRSCQQLPTEDLLCARWRSIAGGNLLIDPAFRLNGWATIEDPAVVYTAEADCMGRAGAGCATIMATAQPQARGAGHYQCMRLTPGATYTFSAWLRVEGPPDLRWRELYIQGDIDGSPRGIGAAYLDGGADWHFVERQFIAPEYDKERACFYPLRLYGAGQAWILEPTLRQTAPA